MYVSCEIKQRSEGGLNHIHIPKKTTADLKKNF